MENAVTHSDVLIIGAGPTGLVLALWLTKLGVAVEQRTELIRFTDEGGGITASLHGPNAHGEDCEASFFAGCDDARSLVGETLGTGVEGGTYRQVFYIADVEAAGRSIDGELHADLDKADFLAVFPLAGDCRARLIGTVRDERADRADTLRFEDVSRRAIDHLKVDVNRVNWFSTYRVHHRVTRHFRNGRAFLLGDAAHIHSPAGGQGMNTGIGDAINLAWKLAAALSDRAPDSLLDTYETERIGFAGRLVATTDRVFSLATAEGRIADIVRTRIVPVIFPKIVAFEAVRNHIFLTISQITLNYRGSALSVGAAGHVRGGDRLPWLRKEDAHNFVSLSKMVWQIDVWCCEAGAREMVRRSPCRSAGIFWTAKHEAAGLARDALYLLRPDAYVALADPSGTPEAVDRYFTGRGLARGPMSERARDATR